MNEDFPCQEQQSNWSCLPFAVQSVLLYFDVHTGLDQIYAWCGAGQDGIPGACRWPAAVKGLHARFPESDELSRGDWASVEERVAFGELVIVTIADPQANQVSGDHAVVIVAISEVDSQATEMLVSYCDPSDGQNVEQPLTHFKAEWDAAGGKAFMLKT